MPDLSTMDVTSKPAAAQASSSAGTKPQLGFSATGFRNRLQAWYSEHARNLPWRGINDPYATWVAEIMLQQTRVETVQDRYFDFLERFPTLPALADADEDHVLASWSGLGYYRRARLLHRGAQFVVREFQGKLPRTAAELRKLPGVGEYTAAAVASIAFGESVAAVDGNVERVLLRVLGQPETNSSAARAELVSVAQALMPAAAQRSVRGRRPNPPGDHNQAMMELGATVCLPRAPRCLQCPVADLCKTRGEHPTPSRRPQQSCMVAHLVAVRKRGVATEVLLERRPASASLMPGMLELPPLPLDGVGSREPVLRLRHAITNTNYYVQIFAESAPGIAPSLLPDHDPNSDSDAAPSLQPPLSAPRELPRPRSVRADFERWKYEHLNWDEPGDHELDDDAVFVASPEDLEAVRAADPSLLDLISAAPADLEWVCTTTLVHYPLTGLARKSLQRLGIMPMPALRIG